MPTPRSKSISTKVTEEEYAQFETLAGDQTMSEWVRDALLKAARPSPASRPCGGITGTAMILMNILFTIANREPLTTTAMDDIIQRADASKSAKALERLTRATTGPQRG